MAYTVDRAKEKHIYVHSWLFLMKTLEVHQYLNEHVCTECPGDEVDPSPLPLDGPLGRATALSLPGSCAVPSQVGKQWLRGAPLPGPSSPCPQNHLGLRWCYPETSGVTNPLDLRR